MARSVETSPGAKSKLALPPEALLQVEWDPGITQDLEVADRIFRDQRQQGRAIFSVDKKWKLRTQLTVFDATLGRFVVMPRPTAWDKIRGESAP